MIVVLFSEFTFFYGWNGESANIRKSNIDEYNHVLLFTKLQTNRKHFLAKSKVAFLVYIFFFSLSFVYHFFRFSCAIDEA